MRAGFIVVDAVGKQVLQQRFAAARVQPGEQLGSVLQRQQPVVPIDPAVRRLEVAGAGAILRLRFDRQQPLHRRQREFARLRLRLVVLAIGFGQGAARGDAGRLAGAFADRVEEREEQLGRRIRQVEQGAGGLDVTGIEHALHRSHQRIG